MWAGRSAIRWYHRATEDIRPFAHAGMRTWKQTEATSWPTENPTRALAGRMVPPLPRSSGTSSDREGVTSPLGSTQGWASAGTRKAVSGHRPQKATSPRLASGSSCSRGLVGAHSSAMTAIASCSMQRMMRRTLVLCGASARSCRTRARIGRPGCLQCKGVILTRDLAAPSHAIRGCLA